MTPGALSTYAIREWFTITQEIYHEGGVPLEEPLIKAAVAVIVRNPFAAKWSDNLAALTDPSASIGAELGRRAAALLDGRPVTSYGKGGIAGLAGEQEHVVACITTIFGDAFREAIGGGVAWIPSVTKTAAAGTTIDIPLAHKDALYVRSHYDGVTLAVPDAPRPNELLIAVAVASGGRVHHRVGGLSASDAVGDGLR